MDIFRYFCSFRQKIKELYRKNKRGVKVFMFHQVNDDLSEWEDASVSITKDGFIAFIEKLIAENYEFIKAEDVENVFTSGNSAKKAVVTFDDVYEDAYLNAFPYLEEKNIPFCVFVTENLIGKEKYINESQLKKLVELPLCTVGFHTKNHKKLRGLSTEEISKEIDSGETEKRIGIKIKLFAYPYGSVYACSGRAVRMLGKSEYAAAFSTISADVTSRDIVKHKYFLPRINVNENNYNGVKL